jgi:chloramphenicol 3-O-phosphotransferase
MRKIIAMIGQPACGKSTIMRAFLERVAPWQEVELTKLVPSLYNKGTDTHVLGRYAKDAPFPGTDRFSMAVQPQAIQFVKDNPTANIVFEGDRLGTQSFLEFCADQPDTEFHLMVVSVSDGTLEVRHVNRGDTQSEIFKKGRETKVSNLRSNMTLMGYITEFRNESPEDTRLAVEWMWHQLIPA